MVIVYRKWGILSVPKVCANKTPTNDVTSGLISRYTSMQPYEDVKRPKFPTSVRSGRISQNGGSRDILQICVTQVSAISPHV